VRERIAENDDATFTVASSFAAGIRDQWKNRYRMTSSTAGTPISQGRKYLPMIRLLHQH
jgi:hypothetical protein